MVRVAIVEDEKEYVQILYGYLKKYEEAFNMKFQISTFQDGLDIVMNYKSEFDIIFLDIQMKHMDGMKAASEIRKLDEDVIFIFITNTIQFAVQGYMVDALGYVLKPVPYLAFSQIVTKGIKQLHKKKQKEYLKIEVEGGVMRLDISTIYFIESQRHYVMVHSEHGDFLTPGPMKDLEKYLANKGFAKCHNAYLINLAHVTSIVQNDVVLSDGKLINISRGRKKEFMDSLTNFVGGIE